MRVICQFLKRFGNGIKTLPYYLWGLCTECPGNVVSLQISQIYPVENISFNTLEVVVIQKYCLSSYIKIVSVNTLVTITLPVLHYMNNVMIMSVFHVK